MTLKLTVAGIIKDVFCYDNKGVEPDLYLTPITFKKSLALIPSDLNGLVYGNEREGWRKTLTSPLVADFPMAFALRLLRQKPPAHRNGLLKKGQELVKTVQAEEWRRIEESFLVAGIDWRSPSKITGPVNDLSVDLSLNQPATGGQPVEITAKVCNGSEHDLSRVSIRLDAERGPWRNKVIVEKYRLVAQPRALETTLSSLLGVI